MTRFDDGLANRSPRPPVAFGVSKLWIPHVLLICFIYYVSLSPQQDVGQNAFWTFGVYIRDLVGGRVVDAGVVFMWVAHLVEAGYTAILARRYETTLAVGVRFFVH
jgi:hypothetical protein